MSEQVGVGRVGKPHGLAGAFFVEDASQDHAWFAVGAELLVDGQHTRVVESRLARGRPVIRLDRRVPRGAALAVPRETLSSPGENEYYVFDLIGLAVEEEGGRDLGHVVDVGAGVANDVLELDSGLALPMVEDCIRRVDLEQGTVIVAPGFADPG